MNASPSTRYSLLLRIKDPQNHAAWVEFLEIYEPLVYRVARREGLQDADARNLCQEVFQAVAKSARQWTPEARPSSFRGWLFRVARNVIVDGFRQQQRHPRGTGSSDVQRLLENMPAEADICASEIESEYRRNVLRVAARAIQGGFTTSTWQAFWQTAVHSRGIAEVETVIGFRHGDIYHAGDWIVAHCDTIIDETAT